jgi:predicted outer membrane protein
MVHLCRWRSMVGLLALGGLLACDRPRSDSATAEPRSATPPESVATATTHASPEQPPAPEATMDLPGGAPATESTLDVASLDDAALAALLQSIHLRIAQEGQVAEATTKTPEVAQLGRELSLFHTHVLSTDQGLFQQLAIVPRVNDASRQIDADATDIVFALRQTRGSTFDSDYLDQQVLAFRESSELFDRMIPAAKSPALKAEIARNRADLVRQLQQVTRVQRGLRPGVTNMQPEEIP